MVSAVLFDLDDTLLDEWGNTRAALWVTVADLAGVRRLDPTVVAEAVLGAAQELWQVDPQVGYCHRIGISSHEALWATFGDGDHPALHDLRARVASFQREAWRRGLERVGVWEPHLPGTLARRFVIERQVRQRCFPEVVGVLLEVARAGFQLAVVTNGDPHLQATKLSVAGLLPYFPVRVISGVVDIGKPDPGIFAVALERLGVPPERAVMIGDSLPRDIAGGIAAGLRTVWLDRGCRGRPDAGPTPDATLADLTGLTALLRQWADWGQDGG